MMNNKLKQILSKVLEIEESQITDESSPNSIENWDSFNGLMLVSELEEAFKISFTFDEVVAVKNVADIKKALIAHGVSLDDK